MHQHGLRFAVTRVLLLLLLSIFVMGAADAADDKCESAGGYAFVCGPIAAEDLVQVPGTKWIIASGMAPGAPITLIDSQQKSWSVLYPADAPRAVQDMKTYGACPGTPDPNNCITHGLHIRATNNGHSTLSVVGHGGREAIEVFDVDRVAYRGLGGAD